MGDTEPGHAGPCVVVGYDGSEAARGAGRVGSLLGSVAQDVLHRAKCPVLVIPKRAVDAYAASAGAKAATQR